MAKHVQAGFFFLTVLIKVRSIRFFITVLSSSGETSPPPSVNPLIKILFHSSSGAARDQQLITGAM